jgi:hypothetical protein
MKHTAQKKRRIQEPNQKYRQNPPDSTTVAKTAERILSIPVTTKPTSFAIVVASRDTRRCWLAAGGSDKLVLMNEAGVQIAGHAQYDLITRCGSAH